MKKRYSLYIYNIDKKVGVCGGRRRKVERMLTLDTSSIKSADVISLTVKAVKLSKL